jgi:two-component system sensor histidine kinase BaeS
LIIRIQEDFQARFNEAGVTLASQIDETCPSADLDPSRISQVIYNVLQNSLRHTPQGGRVEISTSCDGSKLKIYIRDSGEGIPEDSLLHLFDRFYRSDQSRSRDKGGSGLGLAIARQIILAHGGQIEAANHPQGGAEITIHLPVGGE